MRRNDLVSQDKIRMKIGSSVTKRINTHVNLDQSTLRLIDRIVELGRGKYGSSFIEHGVRFFVACLSGDPNNMDVSISELARFVITPNFSENLRMFADKWDEARGKLEL